MLKNKKLIIALLLIPQILLVKLLASFPEFVEQFYSNGLYSFTSKLLRYALGWLPFSFGDLFYAFAIIYVIRWLILNRKRIIKDTKNWLIDVFATLSIVYFAFHIFWALNYYREPLHKSLNLGTNYTTEQLKSVTHKLITKTNTLHNSLSENDTLKIAFPFQKNEMLEKIPLGYQALAKTFPHLEYKGHSLKKSLLSLPLTYMGFSGYLNPITNEAQVNSLIPKFKFPTTASHEVAHQIGYAAENEANFIGYLAASNHPDVYFQYSASAFGLRHCLSELYKRDPDNYSEILKTINKGVLKNYQETSDFWNSYKNPLEPLFKKTYNGYLKANQQKGGIKSYSYVVALLVNYLK